MIFEYKVVLAPKRPERVKGLKRGEDKFAASLAQMMNKYAADGWEYQRTDTLPVESRSGLTSKTTTFQNMLVFRRALEAAQTDQVDETEAVAEEELVEQEELAFEEQVAFEEQQTYQEQPALYAEPVLQEAPMTAPEQPALYAEPAAYEPEPAAYDPAARVEPMLTAPVAPPEMPAVPPAPEQVLSEARPAPEYDVPAQETAEADTLPDNVAEFEPVRPVFRRRSSGGAA